MLRNLIANYIDSVSERELDYPLLSLLAAKGFYDIHYTHGTVEFGKDFIAKQKIDGIVVQYAFQSKAGNIDQGDWRNQIQHQLLEAETNNLSHPHFDSDLPRQTVLICTGKLTGNAALALQNFNDVIVRQLNRRKIITWDRESLISDFHDLNPVTLYEANIESISQYSRFLRLYSQCLASDVPHDSIEFYTRTWQDCNSEPTQFLLRVAIESELLTSALSKQDCVHESIIVWFGCVRSLASIRTNCRSSDLDSYLLQLIKSVLTKVHRQGMQFITRFIERWKHEPEAVVALAGGMIQYLATCAQLIEIAGAVHSVSEDASERQMLANFIAELVKREAGCCHPISDRYVVTIVVAVLVLMASGQQEVVSDILRKVAIWMLDRYETGTGLADISADEYAETAMLLGLAFDLPGIQPRRDSFLATCLCDMAVLIGDNDLLALILNDIAAVGIYPIYWMIPDSHAVFYIEDDSIVAYPNVEFLVDENQPDRVLRNHVDAGPQQYSMFDGLGPSVIVSLMLLMRERYFPAALVDIVSAKSSAGIA